MDKGKRRAPLQRVHVRQCGELSVPGLATSEGGPGPLPPALVGRPAGRLHLPEFLHPPLLDRCSVVVVGAGAARLLADLGHLRGWRQTLPDAVIPLLCADWLLYLGRRECRHVLQRLEVPEPIRWLASRPSRQD
ncbi:hypothetical protein D3C73_1395770 [compost metagenome]